MDTFFRIAEKDAYILLERFSEGAAKKNGLYKRFGYDKWKKLKTAGSWEIRFSDNYIHSDPLYSTKSNAITVRAIYGDPADEDVPCALFDFGCDDYTFGSFLQDMRKEGVLKAMSNSFDNSIYADVSCTATTASSYVDALSTSISTHDYYTTTNINGTSLGSPYSSTITIDGDVILNGDLKIKENKGDTKNMNNTGIKFDFGTCEKDNIRMSMYGIAVKNAAGEWVSYDTKTDSVINVDIFNFNGGKYLFKMPVALKDIKKGDAIVHNKVPMYISKVEDGKIFAVDPVAGEEKCVLLTKNMFGFDFATKIVSLFDMGNAVAPSKDSPFGNMWPLLLADGNVDPLMMMAMNGGMKDMNPMMMYLLMNKDSNKDMGLLMAMSMMNNK